MGSGPTSGAWYFHTPGSRLLSFAGINFRRDIERFAYFSVKNLIDNGLIGEKSRSKT